jgi:hypothetical protein
MLLISVLAAACCLAQRAAPDTNDIYKPFCAWIQHGDGFTFGAAFVRLNSSGQTQLSPCDRRLNLASSVQLAVFCPKVDEISLVTINTTTGFNTVSFPFLLSLLEFDFSIFLSG